MGDNRIASLTPQQLACLRKASEFKNSKTIAYEMGISSKTVDRHIEEANHKLGVTSRKQAIQLLLESDTADGKYTPGGFSRLDPQPQPASFPERELERDRLRDVEERPQLDNLSMVPQPTLSQEREPLNDVTMQLKTVALIIAIAAGLVGLIGQYTAVIAAAESLAAAIRTQIPTR